MRDVLKYWNDLLPSTGERSAIIILTGEYPEVDQLMIRYLPLVQKERKIDRFVVVAPDETIIQSAVNNAVLNVETHLCTEEQIDAICRAQALDNYFYDLPIFVDRFNGREDADGFRLVGYCGITIQDLVALVFLQLSHTPKDDEISQWNTLNTHNRTRKPINWKSMEQFIPKGGDKYSSVRERAYDRIDALIQQSMIMPDDPIVIHGDTKTANACLQYLSNRVISIADQDSSKWGEMRGTVPIIDPDAAYERYDPNLRILVTNGRFRSICEELYARGFCLGQQVFLLNDPPKENLINEERISSIEHRVDESYQTYRAFRFIYPKQTILLSAWEATGDIYICAMYLAEFVNRMELHDYIIVVTMPAAQRVASMCGLETVLLTEAEAFNIMDYARWNGFEENGIININVFVSGRHRLFALSNLVDWNTFHQRLVFQSDVRRTCPSFQQRNSTHWFKKYHLQTGRTVLIAPYSQTMGHIPDNICCRVVSELKELGYSVVTNTAKNEKPLDGTIGLMIPFIELIDFVNKAGAVISIRSGLCDIVSSTTSKMIVLYPEKNEIWPRYFGLERMGLKTEEILELRLDEYPMEHMVEKIVGFIDGRCVQPANA